MSATGQVLGAVVGRFPPALVRSMSSQYSAGTTAQSALEEAAMLARANLATTVAALGEAAASPSYAAGHVNEIRSVLGLLASRPDLDVRLGIKPTALGLGVGARLAAENLRTLADEAAEQGRVVEVDMEQYEFLDDTLKLVTDVRAAGYSNVHVVIQAYLYRTQTDVDAIIEAEIPARIVKGAYREHAGVAFQLRESIRENYMSLVDRFLTGGVPVAAGTHDELLLLRTINRVRELGLDTSAYELQMIMGIQETLRQRLVEEGHPVRVTVHFGADLHLWSIRRLKENPEIAKYAIHGVKDIARGGRRTATRTTPRN